LIIKLSFALIGGVNFGLEKSWRLVDNLLKRYPHATWRKIVNWKKGRGEYIIEI